MKVIIVFSDDITHSHIYNKKIRLPRPLSCATTQVTSYFMFSKANINGVCSWCIFCIIRDKNRKIHLYEVW